MAFGNESTKPQLTTQYVTSGRMSVRRIKSSAALQQQTPASETQSHSFPLLDSQGHHAGYFCPRDRPTPQERTLSEDRWTSPVWKGWANQGEQQSEGGQGIASSGLCPSSCLGFCGWWMGTCKLSKPSLPQVAFSQSFSSQQQEPN